MLLSKGNISQLNQTPEEDIIKITLPEELLTVSEAGTMLKKKYHASLTLLIVRLPATRLQDTGAHQEEG